LSGIIWVIIKLAIAVVNSVLVAEALQDVSVNVVVFIMGVELIVSIDLVIIFTVWIQSVNRVTSTRWRWVQVLNIN